MKILTWHAIKQSTMQFLIVQLFITLVSLPIIIAWGLPLSLLSPIGNLIFSPFLTLFLLLASIIFFTQIICVPNGIFIWLLEYLTIVWKYLLGFSSQSAMYAFKKPSIFVLVLIPLFTLLLVHHPLMHKPHNRLAGLLATSFLVWNILTFSISNQSWIKTIECNNGFVSLLHHNNKTILIDPGVIGRRISAPSWISFTLIPEIIKLTGSLNLDAVMCTKIGKVQFDALQTLATKMNINRIYMPAFEGEFETNIKKSFNRFYATARAQDARMVRCYTQPITINENGLAISIEPEKKQTYHTVKYTMPTITAFIDNEPVPIYSPKNNNPKRK